MDETHPEENRVIAPPFSLDAFAALSVEERRPYKKRDLAATDDGLT
jgi:hypothetical protein